MIDFMEHGIDVRDSTGVEAKALCPQCSHTRKKSTQKCLNVNTETGVWHCWHCGWSGKAREPDRPAPVRVQQQPKAYTKPAALPLGLTESARKWFEGRGITPEVLLRNRVTVSSVFMPQIGAEVRAVAFPYLRAGETINCKYRDREKNFRMETGAERILYGLNDMADVCVIVEGEIDKLSVEVAGITSCVSVPDGAPAENTKDYASKFTFLEADWERVEAVREWIIAVDNDGPGKRLEDELSRRLGREKCRRVTWPTDCKDANDVLRSFGPEVLRECLDNAEPFPLSGVFDVTDLSYRIDHLYEHGWEKGVTTGWDELDRLYSVRAGEFTVVTGMPNSGKSNWVD